MLSKAHDAITRIHPGEWSAQRHMNLSWPRGLVTGQGKFQTFFALAPGNIGPREKWQEVIWIHTFPQRVPAGEGGVQFSSVSQSCPTLCDPMNRSMPGLPSITISRSSLRFMSIESVMPPSHLILCRPLLLLTLILPSIRVFSNESVLHMTWPKYWSFSFSIIPSKEIPELISFRMGWLDLLAVQGTLKSLLQHHSSKASILRCSAFFTVQLSHP